MGMCRQHCQLPNSGFVPIARMRTYKKGWKYCRLCAAMIQYEGRHCPCCGGHMRYRSRYYHTKQRTDLVRY